MKPGNTRVDSVDYGYGRPRRAAYSARSMAEAVAEGEGRQRRVREL